MQIPDLDLSLIQLGDNEDAMLTLSVTREAIVARKFSRMVKYAIQVQREQLVREMRHAMRFLSPKPLLQSQHCTC